jgi:outer membrane protein OmpU
MKKLLLASSALVLSAGVAAAEVTIGGTARAGLVYDSSATGTTSKTTVNMRLRFNIDAKKELDSGVTLGGRIRMQYDQSRINDSDDIFGNRSGAVLNAANLYASVGGLRVEVGNVDTAVDSMALLYNAELGYIGTVQGSYAFANYAFYETNPYGGAGGAAVSAQQNRMGVAAVYSMGDLTARLSYITPNQNLTNLGAGTKEEIAVSVDYKVGQFSFGIGAAMNGGFVADNDVYALTGEYAINDTTAVGVHYIDNGSNGATDNGRTVTLYGRTSVGNGIGLGAFVSNVDDKAAAANTLTEKTSYGLGFDYDLGGATLAGTIQKTHTDTTYADLGIRFSF